MEDHPSTATVIMDRAGTSETEEIPEVRVDSVRPLIESFFKRMTEEQWTLLKSGSPDNATKILLADLLLDIITSVSKALLTALGSTHGDVSEELVLSSLGNTLPQSFAEVLDVHQVRCVSSERLSDLIAKEVAESVNSALSATVCFAEPELHQHVTPPGRLNAMLTHVCNMLKEFMAKMKILCTHRPHRQRKSPATSQEELSLEDLESADIDDGCQSSDKPVEPEIPEKTSSEDSSVKETAKSVQDIIMKEVSEIIEPLLDDVSDSEYELLQSESSMEIEVVADEIAQIIEKVKSSEKTDMAGPSPKPKEKTKLSMTGVWDKIKSFLAKCFAKAWIHHMVAQLRNKFHKDSKVESRESIQSLMADVDSLLLTEDGEAQQGGNEVCVFRRFENISSGGDLIFTQELSDLLYRHTTDGMVPEMTPAAMYADIQNRVRSFLGLMSWWLNTQAGSHSRRMTHALMDTESQAPMQVPEVASVEESEPLAITAVSPAKSKVSSAKSKVSSAKSKVSSAKPDAKARAGRYKMSVEVLMEKLVSRIFNKSKVTFNFGGPEDIIKHLVEKIWPTVEDLDFNIPAKTFNKLDKAIFKDLCKKWGCAEMVLVSMNLEEPAIEKCIASSLKDHLLTPPKQGNAIWRFLCCLCRVSSKPSILT